MVSYKALNTTCETHINDTAAKAAIFNIIFFILSTKFRMLRLTRMNKYAGTDIP